MQSKALWANPQSCREKPFSSVIGGSGFLGGECIIGDGAAADLFKAKANKNEKEVK